MKHTLSRALLSFTLAVGVCTTVMADVLDDVTSKGQIRIAVPSDLPPFGTVGPDMQPAGYDIDVAKEIAKRLNVKLELVAVIGSARIPALQTNKVDLIVAVLGRNAEREKVIDFTNPYGVVNNSLFSDAATRISGPKDLEGKTIGVMRGGIADSLLTSIAPPSATIKRFEDENSNTSAFLAKQVDAIASGDIIINSLKSKNPSRIPDEKFVLNNSAMSVGLKKGETRLADKVNGIIKQIRGDGTLNGISEKWLMRKLPDQF